MEKSLKSHGKVMEFDGTNCLGTLHEKHDVIIGVCFLISYATIFMSIIMAIHFLETLQFHLRRTVEH